MITTFISTQALSEATRLSLLKLQSKLADAQTEATTWRFADVGASLGYKTGRTVSLRQEHARLQAITDTNALVTARLEQTQAALDGLVKTAQSFMSSLLAASKAETGQGIVQAQAKDALVALTGTLNQAAEGVYLFSGINTDVKPLTDYFASPAPPNRQAVANAFSAAFGMSQSDPAVGSITAADMQTFLDTSFASLFEAPAWNTDWSAASDQNMRSRISTHELIETSANANEEGVRKLAAAYTMLADLGTENLNPDAFQTVVDKAVRLVSEGMQSLTIVQGQLGAAQERIKDANDKMSIQMNLISDHIGALEDVDPAEASTRVSALLTQIETAYALTARVQNLSLLKYL